VTTLTASSTGLVTGILSLGSVGATGGTAGEVYFGGVGGLVNGFRIHNKTGNALTFANASAAKMVILDSGAVGVATTAPTEKLTVHGAIRSTAPSADFTAGVAGAFMDMASGIARIGTVSGASALTGDVSFIANNAEKARLLANGNFGIGTAAAAAPLHVSGSQILLSSAGNTVLGTTNTTGTVSGSVQALSNQSVRVGSTTSYPTEIVANNAVKLSVLVAGTVNPGADNAQAFGAAGTRWTALYAVNGTIQTSDAREKTAVRSFSDAEITAAKLISKEIGIFQWLTAVDLKGADAARLHTGLTVQKAVEIMTAQGLDPMAYGFICYDEWEDEFIHHPARAAVEEVVVDGVITVEAVEAQTEKPSVQTKTAGNRYSFRYDQLNLFIARGVEARLVALEA
jgi:hypothetical protein